jgi:hypothetical protein
MKLSELSLPRKRYPQKFGALPPGRGRAPLGCRWVLRVERRYVGTILLLWIVICSIRD